MCRMTATQRRTARTAAGDPAELVTQFGRQLLAAGDPLAAEVVAAAVLGLPHREGVDPELAGWFVHALCQVAGEQPSDESAALLRGLAAVAPPAERRAAVTALGVVTAAGHYPPDWAGQIGRAAPGQAWRHYDVFGDTDIVVVTFRYGEAEHAVVVQVDRCRPPIVLRATVLPDVDEVRSVLDSEDDPLVRVEQIELAEARARVEPALPTDPADPAVLGDLDDDGWRLSLPVVRARIRRLPAGGRPVPADHYGPGDRAAAVAEFLASPFAADAGEEMAARFWAEVFAGYSASVPGDPPARVGPLKLPQLLLSYVPNTFALTGEQRRGLPAALTAWTEWAGQRQQLAEPARTALRDRVPEVLASFDAAYDDPENSRLRGYLADLSATTTDAAVLTEALQRRALAVPPPGARGEDPRRQRLDAADPADRRALVEAEYGDCDPPEGMSRPEFLAAAVELVDQLWQDDPPDRWRQARLLAEAGTPDHDVIHELVAAR